MTATLVPAMAPGSADWMRYMTASKIAAAVGLSTYESRFSLWHRMAGLIPPEADDDLKRRGHYLEPAIRQWFADQHPEWIVSTTGTWVNVERPDQAASPDALVHEPCGCDLHGENCCDPDDCGPCCENCPTCPTLARTGQVRPVALAEFKTAHEDEDWGQPGTDDIPVGYRCQVMWQMDTLGVDVCHVAVLTRHLQFAEYVVHHDPAEVEILRATAAEFMDSLRAGKRPDIDSHNATYEAVKALHPLIEDTEIEIDDDTALRYLAAKAAAATAAAEEKHATSLLADAAGSAKRIKFRGVTIANRQSKKGGVPYLVVARNLPDFIEMDIAS